MAALEMMCPELAPSSHDQCHGDDNEKDPAIETI